MPSGGRGLDGRGDRVDRRVERCRVGLAAEPPLGEQVEGAKHAAQIRIRRQRADERLGRDHVVREFLHLGAGEEEDPVALEERPAARHPHIAEKPGLRRQARSQCRGRIGRLVRGRRVHHHDQQADVPRERPVQFRLGLPPREVG